MTRAGIAATPPAMACGTPLPDTARPGRRLHPAADAEGAVALRARQPLRGIGGSRRRERLAARRAMNVDTHRGR